MRGGNWNNGSGAGVFALNLNNSRAISNNNVGFRAAFLSGQIPEAHGLRASAERQKGLASVPIRRSAKNKMLMEAASNPARPGREPLHMSPSLGNGSTLPLRGGSFNGNQTRAGVFALNLNEPRANSNHDIGFRAAFLS